MVSNTKVKKVIIRLQISDIIYVPLFYTLCIERDPLSFNHWKYGRNIFILYRLLYRLHISDMLTLGRFVDQGPDMIIRYIDNHQNGEKL